jgi:hypothetical protein
MNGGNSIQAKISARIFYLTPMTKTLKFPTLLILASLFSVLVLVGCGDKPQKAESGDVKLLESMTADGAFTYKFEYDDKDRIVKIRNYYLGSLHSTKTITYSGNDLVTVEEVFELDAERNSVINFVRNKSTVTIGELSETLTINKDGYVVKSESSHGGIKNFQYRDGNLIKEEPDIMSAMYVYSAKHDDKKSPFSNSATPKWLLQYLFEIYYACRNNVLEIVYAGELSGTFVYEYEYDDDGFPVRQMLDVFSGDLEEVRGQATRFTYRGETKNIVNDDGNFPADAVTFYDSDGSISENCKIFKFEKRTAETLQFVYDAEFNDETITVVVFWSHDADNEFSPYKIDSLRFAHGGKILSAHIDMSSQIFRYDYEPNFHLILLDDYNFDGYVDIAVLSNRGVQNEVYNYFIYNPGSQSFHRSEPLSGMMNAHFNAETQTVTQHNSSGAGMFYTEEAYKWDDVELVLFRTVNQAPDDDNEMLIRTTRWLQDGEWVEETETIRVED